MREHTPCIPDIPALWRDRCGMPLLDEFPIRCKLPLSHRGDHLGLRGKEQIRWPGPGSPVPLCWGATYRCWHEGNRPDVGCPIAPLT
jgi:hypothetical protein